MRTVVRRVLLLSALMSPGALQALGLGDIRLNSALNQPFDAEIELVSATEDDLGALRATLASGDTFTRYGLDRPSFLSDFSFRVAKGADGRDVLRVTSPRPVTEPFVTLLVEANWPRGRLLREYTVLLDPPVYAPAQTAAPEAAVAAPRVSSGGATSVRAQEPAAQEPAAEGSAAQEEPASSVAPAVESQPQQATAAASSIEPGSTYTVRPNDTLFRIASAAHPGTRTDVNRAMVAIYQGNPSAFQNNINVLHSGSTLRIPQSSEVSAVSAAAASAEVARQYETWRSGQAGATTAPTPTDTGRLRLVTPEQGTPAPSTATAVPPGMNVDARIKQLEAELAEARRLLEVRNAELATLQGAAAPVTPQAGATGAEATPSASEPAASDSTPAAEPAVVPATPPVAREAKPEKPTKPARVEPEGPSLLERAMEYWWLLLALVAALGGAWLFQRLRRERGAAEADLEDALGRDMRAARTPVTPVRPRDGGIVVEEKRANEGHRLAPAAAAVVAAPAARATEPVRKSTTVEDTLAGDGPASLESGDPLAEADFHMAYGLYDQAADLVQLAIKREPKRRDLKLKLLEIFFVWGNKDRFLQLAGEMNATRMEAPAGEWDKIMIMGKQIAPKDTMFTGATRSSDDALDLELNDATREIDIDLMVGEAPAPDLDVGETEISRADSSGIDFILDEPARGADEDDSSVGPTVETPQVRRGEGDTAELPVESLGRTPQVRRGEGDTAELPVESLGLDVDALRAIDALDDPDTIITKGNPMRSPVDTGSGLVTIDEDEDLDVDLDMLGSTALMKLGDDTAQMLRGAEQPEEEGVIDLSDSTGALPELDSGDSTAALTELDLGDSTGALPELDLGDSTGALPELDSGDSTENLMRPSDVDFDLGGEPATMSEVGTKLDLARAYIDMGDPEGARSILDEVLGEGSIVQRQEAERLIAALP